MALLVQEAPIVDGPQIHIWVSAWTLACAKEADQRISVKIKLGCCWVPGMTTLNVYISGLDWEDGSGNNIIFRGYVPNLGKVEGFFDLQRRKGWIKFV